MTSGFSGGQPYSSKVRVTPLSPRKDAQLCGVLLGTQADVLPLMYAGPRPVVYYIPVRAVSLQARTIPTDSYDCLSLTALRYKYRVRQRNGRF